MKQEKYAFRKTGICLLTAALMIVFAACGSATSKTGAAIEITEDGTISSHIVESFDKSYYDEEELTQKVLSEAASYNRAAGEGAISVEKVAVDNGTATVDMTYEKAQDYASFNGCVLFLGTANEAKEAGYDLNTVLSGTKNELETIGMSDILSMTDEKILITDMKDPITLNGKAAYISDNVTVSKNLKTVTLDEASEKMAYIIYK